MCSIKDFFNNTNFGRKKPKFVHIHISGCDLCWQAEIIHFKNWAEGRPDEIVKGGLFEDPRFTIDHWSYERGWIYIVMIETP